MCYAVPLANSVFEGEQATPGEQPGSGPLRILFLSHVFPWPLHHGARLTVYHLMRCLARRHRISLISFYRGEDQEPVKGLGVSVHTLVPRSEQIERVSLSPFPYSGRMERTVSEACRSGEFDAAVAFSQEMLPYALVVPGLPVVAHIRDEPWLEGLRRICHPGRPRQLLRDATDAMRVFLHERRYAPRAELVTFVSQVDADVHRRLSPSSRVAVLPNGVDTEYFRPRPVLEPFPNALFVGDLGHLPNYDAVRYFATRVLPAVRRSEAQFKYRVVGEYDPARMRQLDRIPGLVLEGLVPDVRPYLAEASVVVAPMRMGAGIKNKILEAWAMAKPVVATRLACAGLKPGYGAAVQVADEPGDFGRKIIQLVRDRERARRLGLAGRSLAERDYSWRVTADALESVLREAVKRSRKDNT